MKGFKRFVALTLALLMILPCIAFATEIDASEQAVSLEKEVSALLESKNTADHIKALKMLDANDYSVQKEVYNEYDAYLEMREELASSNRTLNSARGDMAEMQAYVNSFEENYKSKIEYLNTLTDEQLRYVNYREDQIRAIRNFDGSPEMMRASASECYVYGGFTNFTSSATFSSAKLIAAFEWNGLYNYSSLFGNKDIFGVTWLSPFASDTDTEEAYVTYRNANTMSSISNVEYTTEPEGMFATGFVFNKSKMKYVNNNPVSHLVDSGSIICYLDTYSKETQILGFAKYGKTTGSVTPSFDVTPDGVGLSISYVERVTDAGQDSFRYPE